ncbi:hypothetical protein HaLaN_21257 [Haematococcus lacustris]|uniref:Uncharacterized protein n=1 Tax=Haematococcus lacustris TaxID=44745 RepID=A0A699ZVG3_HAELA|nr:hypothetical protein HaLaN_21257 [Haematococcus lacustris]
MQARKPYRKSCGTPSCSSKHHRLGQVVVNVGDHERQQRLAAAFALTMNGRSCKPPAQQLAPVAAAALRMPTPPTTHTWQQPAVGAAAAQEQKGGHR